MSEYYYLEDFSTGYDWFCRSCCHRFNVISPSLIPKSCPKCQFSNEKLNSEMEKRYSNVTKEQKNKIIKNLEREIRLLNA